MNVIMVLLFVINGVLTMETKTFDKPEVCVDYANKRIEELLKDPHMDYGIWAGCVESQLKEIKRVGQKVYGL